MKTKSDQEVESEGGYAFPAEQNRNYPGGLAQSGMTLRDYFAGQALCGFPNYLAPNYYGSTTVASKAYEMADAMLEARKTKTSE